MYTKILLNKDEVDMVMDGLESVFDSTGEYEKLARKILDQFLFRAEHPECKCAGPDGLCNCAE